MTHEHTLFLARFNDNFDEFPSTLYGQATSDYVWRGVGVFICECGYIKETTYPNPNEPIEPRIVDKSRTVE